MKILQTKIFGEKIKSLPSFFFFFRLGYIKPYTLFKVLQIYGGKKADFKNLPLDAVTPEREKILKK